LKPGPEKRTENDFKALQANRNIFESAKPLFSSLHRIKSLIDKGSLVPFIWYR
jgi:hypothetical protein